MKIPDWLVRLSKPTTPVDKNVKPGDKLSALQYLELLRRLQGVPIKKLWPAAVSVSSVLFFAISGLLAWLVLLFVFVFKLFWLVVS